MDISKVRRFWTEMVFDETNKLMGQPVSWLLTMDMHVLTEGNQWDLFFTYLISKLVSHVLMNLKFKSN